MNDEIFGPVLAVQTFKTEEEAIGWQTLQHGLGLVFSPKILSMYAYGSRYQGRYRVVQPVHGAQ